MVYETKEQIIKRKKLARYRLRALIRKARLNAYWLSELDDLTLGDNALKNITIIMKRPTQSRSVLTIHDKTMLKKAQATRTMDEVENLTKLFDELPCFQSFTPLLRKSLIDLVEFQYFERDRLVLKEGHISQSMYFILTGEIVISKLIDTKEGKAINQPVNILSAGDIFGHVGLIYDIARNASVSTQTDCELLCVFKEDFDNILKEVMVTRNESIKSAIRRFEYFNNFTEEKITECCAISKIEQFNPQQTVFSPNDILNFSYFVLSGKCMILQCLKIRNKGKRRSELVVAKKKLDPLELAMSKLSTRETGIASMIEPEESGIKHHFIDVGTYSCGGVFGIGEEMENRIIIARNLVHCLMVPRYWLFQKAQNIGNVWQRIKLFLNSAVPSQQKLYENFLANQKWKKYKKKTIDEIIRQYRISGPETQSYNIPVICRVEDC